MSEVLDERLLESLPALRIGPTERVEVSDLVLGETPRKGADDPHYEWLCTSDGEFPPIYVHRETKSVIDGRYRLLAARRQGKRTIAVRFVDGPTRDTFVVAVRANTSFGKPLSLAEREHCAQRILLSHPTWSDRAIAETCGLSAHTVATLRTRSTAGNARLHSHRLGRDGKLRPLNGEEGRLRAAQLLAESPGASLREIARRVGISPATVRDVQQRVRRGEPPQTSGLSAASASMTASAPVPQQTGDLPSESVGVLEDQAVRSMPDAEEFTEWFATHRISPAEWRQFVEKIPLSRIYVVVDEARSRAEEWRSFSEALEARVNRRRS